jgi:hypothetical protein
MLISFSSPILSVFSRRDDGFPPEPDFEGAGRLVASVVVVVAVAVPAVWGWSSDAGEVRFCLVGMRLGWGKKVNGCLA